VRNRWQVLFVVLALNLSSLEAAGDSQKGDKTGPTTGPSRPIDIVKSSVSRALSTVQSQPVGVDSSDDRRAEIQRLARHLFDFNEMARRALGQNWQALSSQERNEFVQLFTDVLQLFFVAIVEGYSGEWVAIMREEVAGGYARVQSRVIPNVGSEISVEYRLFESGSRWAVYDVVLDGRSLVSNYRSQFDSIARTSFVSQLLERMRTEQSTRTQSPGAVVTFGVAELREPSVRERWAAGLLLGAALYGRRR
jgi:phospholipid transport system substrate-binding protein